MGSVHEECGVFGLYARKNLPAADLVMGGLLALQHRGQESCGIVVNDDGVFSTHKGLGLAGDVFSPGTLSSLGGGVCRPPGPCTLRHHRPNPLPQCPAHCGQPHQGGHGSGPQRKPHQRLRAAEGIGAQGAIFHTTSDTEVISYLITRRGSPRPPSRKRCTKPWSGWRGPTPGDPLPLQASGSAGSLGVRPCATAGGRTEPMSSPQRAAPFRQRGPAWSGTWPQKRSWSLTNTGCAASPAAAPPGPRPLASLNTSTFPAGLRDRRGQCPRRPDPGRGPAGPDLPHPGRCGHWRTRLRPDGAVGYAQLPGCPTPSAL